MNATSPGSAKAARESVTKKLRHEPVGGAGSHLFAELRTDGGRYRDVERDAMHDDEVEKILDEDDMWRVYERDT